MIVCIAANVWPPIDQQHLFARTARESLGQNAAGITCSHYQIVEQVHPTSPR
jgi:hypothetical protein